MEKVHGYKVFNKDWMCFPSSSSSSSKQYACPGKFEEDVEPSVGRIGMHFCKKLSDCFHFYNFNSKNKVAEVIAYGKVAEEECLCCTNKLEIVREVPWDEVLQIVNIGKYNTGLLNTGEYNAGNYNVGDLNPGSFNVGDRNTGDRNVGKLNTGNCNIGWSNTGLCNTGDYNAGDWNVGDHNTGEHNTGDWNTTIFGNGCFNTVEHKIMMFDKPSDMTLSDWRVSDGRTLLDAMPDYVYGWINSCDMTSEEKESHPEHKTTGGYLKVYDEYELKQLRQKWWDELEESDKDIILNIPNFDKDIFYKCTGIKVVTDMDNFDVRR